jgi:L-malate glycosyltransferase
MHPLRVIRGHFVHDPYYQTLKNYIEMNNLYEYIELAGYESDVDKIYRGAQLSLVCSRSEGMGRVTVESMLRAIPVIAYKEGGSTEIIIHNVDGILYTGNHEALAAEIKALVLDSQKLKSLADRARINAKAKFNVAQYRDKFLDMIEEIQSDQNYLTSS